MINHVRTLLLNANSGDTSRFGEEVVPSDFRAVTLPSWLQSVDGVLFGRSADRATRNYRLAQIMPLLHKSELGGYALSRDSRITYKIGERNATSLPLFPQIVSGPGSSIRLYGEPPINEDGRMDYQWRIEFLGIAGSLAQIKLSRGPNAVIRELPFDMWSEPTLMPETRNLYVSIAPEMVADNTRWDLQFLARPTVDLGQVAANLRSLGDDVRFPLFGTEEPGASFGRAGDSEQLARCLSGFALAMAFRIDDIRSGNV